MTRNKSYGVPILAVIIVALIGLNLIQRNTIENIIKPVDHGEKVAVWLNDFLGRCKNAGGAVVISASENHPMTDIGIVAKHEENGDVVRYFVTIYGPEKYQIISICKSRKGKRLFILTVIDGQKEGGEI